MTAMNDTVTGDDALAVALGVGLHDVVGWRCEWDFRMFDLEATAWARELLGRDPQGVDFDRLKIAPYESKHIDGNLLTTAGVTRIVALMIGAGGQAATATAARIGVGDGAGTAVIGDTDLSAVAGSTHRQFAVMDATFPSAALGVATFQSTFATGVANFAWNEFGIDIGTPTVTAGTTVNATLLNHKTSLGSITKTSAATAVASATITIA